MIEASLVAFLRAQPAVAALIGSGESARLFSDYIPQKNVRDQMPCIVYSVTGENRAKGYCGTFKTVEAIITIDCYGTTLKQARRVNLELRRALIDYRGTMHEVKVSDVTLSGSIVLSDMEPGLMRVSDTYSIWYT